MTCLVSSLMEALQKKAPESWLHWAGKLKKTIVLREIKEKDEKIGGETRKLILTAFFFTLYHPSPHGSCEEIYTKHTLRRCRIWYHRRKILCINKNMSSHLLDSVCTPFVDFSGRFCTLHISEISKCNVWNPVIPRTSTTVTVLMGLDFSRYYEPKMKKRLHRARGNHGHWTQHLGRSRLSQHRNRTTTSNFPAHDNRTKLAFYSSESSTGSSLKFHKHAYALAQNCKTSSWRKRHRTVHPETVMQHTRHANMWQYRQTSHVKLARFLVLWQGSTAIAKSLYFLFELRFVGADELVDLLSVLEEEERRGCTDVPCWAKILQSKGGLLTWVDTGSIRSITYMGQYLEVWPEGLRANRVMIIVQGFHGNDYCQLSRTIECQMESCSE
jgi:hypothetical protein